MSLLSSIKEPQDLKKYTTKELYFVAEDIRKIIIETVAVNGGHLASNFGVVELTLALHSVFNSPTDKIIWDVGHQAYAHKLLTGRQQQFSTIRTYQGLSGYPVITENKHDIFGAGHSTTSLSAALGFAIERDLNNRDEHIVAVIGDGSLTGGMAWEALNNIGHLQKKVIIIINDNQMSISPNTGAIPRYLNGLRTHPKYEKLKRNTESFLQKIPLVGKGVSNTIERVKNSLKYFMLNGVIFEELGLTYIGPIDGHNIEEMKIALDQAASSEVPVIVHCVTKKGNGYAPAMQYPDKYHGVSPFNIETGQPLKLKKKKTFSKAFGDSIVRLAKNNNKITAITAAMSSGVGLDKFAKQYPKRFFDVAIAEQHAVTLAAGMAAAGLRPIVAIYSTFMQRAYDQIIHDVALQKLPVVFALDRAGLVGADGSTHHGAFDLSFLKTVPGLTVMAASNGIELDEMLEFAVSQQSPVAIRYPRGDSELYNKPKDSQLLQLGKAEIICEGKDVVIWAVGNMVATAFECVTCLNEKGISATVINSRFIKPFDEQLLIKLCNNNKLLVSLEDNVLNGGMAETIALLLTQNNININYVALGIPNRFIPHGNVTLLKKELGLDKESVCNTIIKELKIGD